MKKCCCYIGRTSLSQRQDCGTCARSEVVNDVLGCFGKMSEDQSAVVMDWRARVTFGPDGFPLHAPGPCPAYDEGGK